jgi:hypothetical protein
MAIHGDLAHLSEEAIDEYIELARMGIIARKADRGIYGYPTTLLLFCVIDAMSCHLGLPDYSLGALSDPIFRGAFKGDIKQLKRWYRNLLAHNGMIAPGTVLTVEDTGDAIELLNGEAAKIRVPALFKLVEQAWTDLDKTRLSSRRHHTQPSQSISRSTKCLPHPRAAAYHQKS